MRENKADHTILVDSDGFVGLFYAADSHHRNAHRIYATIKQKRRYLVTTSFVIAETATVLSHKEGQETARSFLDWSEGFPIIHITEDLQREALAIFREQAAKGSSVVDCANVAVMKRFSVPAIFSFDKVYSKKFGLKVAA